MGYTAIENAFGKSWRTDPPHRLQHGLREQMLYWSAMAVEYFKERLRVQEEEIEKLRSAYEAAKKKGNKRLMGNVRKRLELAMKLRDSYRRMLDRDKESGQIAV